MSWATYFSSDWMQGNESENGWEDTPGVWRPLLQLFTWPFSSSCADESPDSTCYYDHRAGPGARCWCSSSQMQIPAASSSMDSHECFLQKKQNESRNKSKSSIGPSEMTMNYNYTPPTLFNTANRNTHYDFKEPEVTRSVSRTRLVGEEPGFIRSPHSAPNRDWSHGLPYPFRKPGESAADLIKIVTFSPDSRNRTSSKTHHFVSQNFNSQGDLVKSTSNAPSTFLNITSKKTSSKMLPKPCILSNKLRSKFRKQIGGHQVYLHRLESGKVVFINSSC